MDDLISRQAAIDELSQRYIIMDNPHYIGYNAGLDEAQKVIKALPPVQPKRGKWLPDNRCGGGYWVCSSCKYPTEAFAADVIYKYCPFCGADMRGETDAETH